MLVIAIIAGYYWFAIPPISMPESETAGVETFLAEISDFAFMPSEIKIKAGMKIVWTNKDATSHTVTSDTGVFSSNLLNQGQSFEFIFTEKGTYHYYCVPHPFMKGTVIVE